MKQSVIETSTARLCLREDGVMLMEALPRQGHTVKDAHENMSAACDLAADGKVPLIVDLRAAGTVERDARLVYSRGAPDHIGATALLVESSIKRTVVNFMINVSRPPYPIRVFTSAEEATTWLLEQPP